MLDADAIPFYFVRHLVQCPYCEQQMVQSWPGDIILYSEKKCKHCGHVFVITLNQSHS